MNPLTWGIGAMGTASKHRMSIWHFERPRDTARNTLVLVVRVIHRWPWGTWTGLHIHERLRRGAPGPLTVYTNTVFVIWES